MRSYLMQCASGRWQFALPSHTVPPLEEPPPPGVPPDLPPIEDPPPPPVEPPVGVPKPRR